jgi:hypothetical protein
MWHLMGQLRAPFKQSHSFSGTPVTLFVVCFFPCGLGLLVLLRILLPRSFLTSVAVP